MNKKERYSKVLEWFATAMPEADTELTFNNTFELLVAVMLSAQCTDKRVNMVTKGLFAAYPTPATMAAAKVEDVFALIRSVSYPNSKAAHLVGMAQMVQERFGGVVPDNMEDLQSLPGVGRKTANVMMAVAFEKPAMPVDTHVFRVSERIGLTTHSRSPLETERELVKYIPQHLLSRAHHWILLHGRYMCTARTPKCAKCGLTKVCRYYMNEERKSSGK